jgi:signal transduction histidine kinase
MHAGVVDYLPKDAIKPSAVRRATQNAIEKADLQKEILRANAELSSTVRSLQLRQEEIESFYHNVSHELKTPLTGAREFVSLVIDGAAGAVTEAQADLLRAAVRSCDQMVTCINDMLDASRIETDKLLIRAEKAELRPVLQDAIRSLGRAASESDVGVVLRCQADPIELSFDPQRIYQVVTNLVGNAIKFSRAGTVVTVEVDCAPGTFVGVRVVDQGSGIEAADLDRIFDRLFQSREADAASLGGLGMGLHICKGIVENHGGQITVESTPGKGSTFTFTLPRERASNSNEA